MKEKENIYEICQSCQRLTKRYANSIFSVGSIENFIKYNKIIVKTFFLVPNNLFKIIVIFIL